MLEPKTLQKVARISATGSGIHNNIGCCQTDTKCRFAAGGNRTLSERRSDLRNPRQLGSGRVDRGGVHEPDRYIVLNGINTSADAAFQALPVGIQNDWLFTDWANQHVEQILRDHNG